MLNGSVFLHLCDKIQSSMREIFTQMHSKISVGASYTEFPQAPKPQTAFPTFFSNLDLSKICDNKTFWKTIQPFFLKNEKLQTKLLFVDEDETVISDDQLVLEELNQFFKNATKALNIR